MSAWSWMMDWCRAKRVPPASAYWWSQAEIAYHSSKTT